MLVRNRSCWSMRRSILGPRPIALVNETVHFGPWPFTMVHVVHFCPWDRSFWSLGVILVSSEPSNFTLRMPQNHVIKSQPKISKSLKISKNLKNSKQYCIWSITNGISSYYEKTQTWELYVCNNFCVRRLVGTKSIDYYLSDLIDHIPSAQIKFFTFVMWCTARWHGASLTLIGKFLGNFWDRFTGKLIHQKIMYSFFLNRVVS